MSLKNFITEYLKEKAIWVHKGELGRKAVLEWGFENENMGRRCRELENTGVIERELRKNPNTGVWEAWYRYKGEYSDRGSGQTVNLLSKSSVGATPTSPTISGSYCCISNKIFGVCSRDCKTLIKESKQISLF